MKIKFLFLLLLVQSSLSAQNSNDECVNAIPLTISTEFVQGTIINEEVNATVSGIETPGCPSYNNDNDLWYSFVAPVDGEVVFEVDVDVGGIGLFTGSCSNLTYIDCFDNEKHVTGLTSGTTYYIKASSPFSTFSIELHLFLPSTPPVNDECTGALSVPVTLDCPTMFFQYNSESTDGVSLGGNCDQSNYRNSDLWFEFVAPVSGTVDFASNIINGHTEHFTIFEYDCNNLIEIECYSSAGQTTGLTPNNNYYLRVASLVDYISFCISEGPPSPPNDECATPETITVGIGSCGPSVIGSVSGADPSSNFTGCYEDYKDVWFEFIAPPNGSIIITNNLPEVLKESIYTGSCNSLQELDCNSFGSDHVVIGLTPNNTYLLRIPEDNPYSYDFDFCVSEGDPPPTNDDCSDAEVIPYNTVVTSSTTFAAPSSEASPYCEDLSTVKEIWYSITPSSGNGNIIINAVLAGGFALYEGSCGSLTLVQCHDYHSAERQYNDLDIGTTYLLRVWDQSDNGLQFSWYNNNSASPINDDCADAITIAIGVGSCLSYIAVNDGASTSLAEGVPACNDDSYFGGDLWYDFVAPSTGNIIFTHEASSTIINIGVAIYAGSCGSLSEVHCTEELDDGDFTYILGLTPGNSYRLRIWDLNFNEIEDIPFCIEEGLASPVNDDCVDAIQLPVSDGACVTPTEVNNISATSSEIGTMCTSSYGKDVWYSFVAPTSGSVVFEQLSGGQIYLGLFQGTCSGLEELDCTYYNEYGFFGGLVSGNTYYLSLFSQNSVNFSYNFGPSTFCLKEGLPIPPNDLCSNAINLSVDTETSCINTTQGYTFQSSDSGESTSGCDYQTDIWYSFTCPTSGTIDINLQSSDHDIYYEIYEGNCGTLISNLSCKELQVGSNLFGNLTPGVSYFIRIWHENDDEGFFDFCLLEGPTLSVNNECSGALPINVGLDECGTQVFAAFGNSTATQLLCAYNVYGDHDLWYEFVAPASGHIEVSHTGIPGYSGIEIYSNDCNTLTPVLCYETATSSPVEVVNLTPSETYYIMAFSINGDFDFCVKGIPPPAVNDNCIAAISILESTDDACDNLISTSTFGGSDGFDDCESLSKEVFYKFTPTESVNYTIATSNRSYDLNLSIYNGDCTSDLIACANNKVHVLLEANLTYTISIATLDNDVFTDFDLCIHKFMSAEMSNIGINISNPVQNLQVRNGIMVGNTSIDAPGSIRFNGSDIEGNVGSGWVSMTSTSATDDLGNHSATQNLDLNGQKIEELGSPIISTDAANKAYVDSHTDGDASTSNELISSLSLDGSTLTITESAYSKSIDLGSIGGSDNLGNHLATMDIVMNSNAITGLGTPTDDNDATNKAYVDAHYDADNDPNNEIETWATLSGKPPGFADGTDNVEDGDADSSNEIQTISISNNIVSLTNGGMANLTNIDINKISDDDNDSHITFDNVTDQIILTANGVSGLKIEEDSVYIAGSLQVGSGIGSSMYIGDELITDGGANLIRIEANITPSTDNLHNLGGASFKWKNAYLSNKLFLNTSEIYEDGTDKLRTDSHWTPKNNSAKDLGESTLRWRDAHIDRFIYLNDSYLEGKNIGNVTVIESSTNFRPSLDNSAQLGSSAKRWTEVFAANGVINTSDKRAKKNIQELKYGLSDIMKLHAVQFDWKEKTKSSKTIGLIAQELKIIIPEVVVDPGNDNLLGVKYSDLIPVLIKAIQEQQIIINTQQKSLTRYEETLSIYDTRLSQLETSIKSKKLNSDLENE